MDSQPSGLAAYFRARPLAALALGVSSGTPLTMVAATLTTRLAQAGISKKSVAAFGLVLLIYNLKPLWAPLVDRFGRRTTWMVGVGLATMAAIVALGAVDERADVGRVAAAALIVAVCGATFDIVIDAYRIELLRPEEQGIGAGMNQYGYRLANAAVAALALVIAARAGWSAAYATAAAFCLPGMVAALVMGEPEVRARIGRVAGGLRAAVAPFAEFLARPGAGLIVVFVLVHKLGDTLANLSFRLLFNDLGFTNDEIATYDVSFGGIAYLVGVFIGGLIFRSLGMTRSVLVSLVLMAVSNLSFAALAAAGHSNLGMAGAIGFENIASGIGGVTVVAFLSALCDARFTATQYALLSAAASVVGRTVSGTATGRLIEGLGYPSFYLLTVLVALPGVVLFWWMSRTGLVERAVVRAPA